jgi:uncharacterized membrane protein
MATNSGTDQLKQELRGVMSALGQRAMSGATSRVSGLTGRLTDATDSGPVGKAAAKGTEAAVKGDSPVAGAMKGGLSGLVDKAKDKLTGGGGGGGKATKATIMIEQIDVGVPVSVAYNQWTQYQDWPDFMKKVEVAEQDEDEPTTTKHKAQVLWSHRSWESTIQDQVPDERIVWRSQGEKGHVDGTVTFHELAPRLTRILVVLEYYPQGFFERTGNLWRAQGRRARLELKHFRRHVMMNTALDPDSAEGWRGEIRDEEVKRTHDEVVAAESDDNDDSDASEGADEAEDEYDEGEGSDEDADEDAEEDERGEADEDQYDEGEDGYDAEPEDDYEADEEESEEEPGEEPEDEYDEEAADEDEEEPADEDEQAEEEEPART